MSLIRIYITAGFLSFTSFSWGQTFSNQGATVSITSDGILSVKGDALNNGTLINDGNLYVSGSWINNMTYEAENGSFILNNPGEQIINHNSQSFANLEITGGGPKVFLADLTVNQRLNLQNGILVAGNDSRLILSDGIEIVGGSESSYVNGTLTRSGTEDLFFPVGTDTEYIPVLFSLLEGDSPEITVLASSTPIPINSTSDLLTSELRHWQVNTNGVLETTLTLPLLNEEFNASIDNIVVVGSFLEGSINNIGNTAVDGSLLEGEISSNLHSPFGLYTVAVSTSDIELPPISVINAVTPSLQDGKHDFLRIDNIEAYSKNRVEIFNRWGDKVFEMDDYDNDEKIFDGRGNLLTNSMLPSGTFYYVIDIGANKPISGFFLLIN